ncbi:hypothetical protein ACRDNQ_05790 [Palleronia sp. KMU-117]|uniref:hypothetical protein n=1 Tax=Palleronia sp. KMU-117 TaxID=3434108 RepID=UPI003D7245CB
MVPVEMRVMIEDTFGEGRFYVRKDMINNAVGYREFSVQDLWTGETRLNETAQKAFVDTVTAVMGKNALRNLATAEKFWQAGVSVAKQTIVIRSVIVPVANLGSNFLQLMQIGVGPRAIAKGFTTKLVEIDQHLRNLSQSAR